MDPKTSAIPGFHKLSVQERLEKVAQFSGLNDDEKALLLKEGSLDLKKASIMIENVIGTFHFPFGVATNFLINGKDCLIPMVIEEPSVVAGASYAAKLARPSGGFRTTSTQPIMIGQVQLVNVQDIPKACKTIEERKQELTELANKADSVLVKLGGGLKDIETRELDTPKGKMLIVHLLVDVRDAMGANAVNTMAERLSPVLEEASGGEARLKIITNLAKKRIARAEAVWKKEEFGEAAVDRVLEAAAFAESDHFRCTTHNKGIMNGIDAVALATGNDFRAVESGAHSHAATDGYSPLTHYEKTPEGDLLGRIELPLAVGTIGGSISTNPLARVSLKILGVKTSQELAEVMAAVGLAQNFAAMRALANEGIQLGHMRLHAKNLAITAGAAGNEVENVAQQLIAEKEVTATNAEKILAKIRQTNK